MVNISIWICLQMRVHESLTAMIVGIIFLAFSLTTNAKHAGTSSCADYVMIQTKKRTDSTLAMDLTS